MVKRHKLSIMEGIEDPVGAWVTWEDHRQSEALLLGEIESFRAEIRRLKVSTVTAEGGVIKVRDVTECTCYDCWGSLLKEWVCPRHGYKRR